MQKTGTVAELRVGMVHTTDPDKTLHYLKNNG